MTNSKKMLILVALLFVLAFFTIQAVKLNKQINEDKKIKPSDTEQSDTTEDIDVPDTAIYLNTSLKHSLVSYDYNDMIEEKAISTVEAFLETKKLNKEYYTEAVITDIVKIEAGDISEYDNVAMFNLTLSMTDVSKQKTVDTSNYILFYNRWDTDGKTRFISSLTYDQMTELYSYYIEEFDNDIFDTACNFEKIKYLATCNNYTEEGLKDAALEKASQYLKEMSDNKTETILADNVSENSEYDKKVYTFDTSNNNKISLVYILLEENNLWAFDHAELHKA